jgi:hypothetical protein
VPTKTEDTYLSITVQPTFGTENLFLDSVYTTVEGHDFKVLDFKFYMTDVKNNSNSFPFVNLNGIYNKTQLTFYVGGDSGTFIKWKNTMVPKLKNRL